MLGTIDRTRTVQLLEAIAAGDAAGGDARSQQRSMSTHPTTQQRSMSWRR